ncbi:MULTISPECIES: hypothetical protein [unclassified Pseudonocardia]|uniref:hypothetical protein n=1 Tax=unclassified Pseudonocardia TaxID=2619320 RepID=UPI001CF628B9|nr:MULTISPECIES: hypothetical protein [unclassified Pseudonocardia]
MSQTLRYSAVSITSDVCSYLTADVTGEAVDAMQDALDAAEAEARAAARAREAFGAHTEYPSHTQGAHNGGSIME